MVRNKLSQSEEGSTNKEKFSHPSQETLCPECGGKTMHDSEHGETRCQQCGLVLTQEAIDRGPEWRSFYADEKDRRNRVGAPLSPLLHDRGLSTTIGWQNKDAYGKQLSAEKRTQMHRLRKWDNRFRTKNAQDRNLKQAFNEIRRMSSALGLIDPVKETTGVIYRRAVSEGLLPGRSIEAMATASLYAAARQHNTPRTLSECAAVSRVPQLPIQRAYRYLSRQLGLQIQPADPMQYIRQFASGLDATEETENLAREILKTGKRANILSGKKPAGLAAAALYSASQLSGEEFTQETISNESKVSHVTIRDRYHELLKIYLERNES
ncbi:TFIIB-type zinc ribbon-containing protein [Halococcus salsus]|uniref:transcription initiation factor IIB n=1 Tax=Halococcus salsus TaxID=2162894 RepID=UPI00135C6041